MLQHIQILHAYVYIRITYMQTSLHAIWSQKPCHKYVAVIQNFKIYHGSFHSLKAKEYLNDEVRT